MRWFRWAALAVIVGAIALFAVYRVRDPDRSVLDDTARQEAPGRFVFLRDHPGTGAGAQTVGGAPHRSSTTQASRDSEMPSGK